MLRVWTPPGFSVESAPHGGWPVLFMCDGQNMFEDWLAHQVCGVECMRARACVCVCVLGGWRDPGETLGGRPAGHACGGSAGSAASGLLLSFPCRPRRCPAPALLPARLFQGTAWRVGEAAAHLIGGKVVPPFVVVAVDSAGPMRSLNYLPYKPGAPGGGCWSGRSQAELGAGWAARACGVRLPPASPHSAPACTHHGTLHQAMPCHP